MAKVYNVNIVGNLTNDNGVLSGFSVNDYATLPETLEGLTINSLEIVFKFKLTDNSSENMIFCTDSTSEPVIGGLRLYSNNTSYSYGLEITSNGGQVGYIESEGNLLNLDTYYFIKVIYSNLSGYGLYKSEDGNAYTLIGTISNTTMPSNPLELIGVYSPWNAYLHGAIDLNESYIKVNGVIWWRGAENITKIQLRHDTAANWTSVNPILLEGEVGIETDTRKQKFGDGVTAWNSLPYDVGSTALQSITSSDVTTALGYTPVNKSGDTMTGGLSTTYLTTSGNINLGGSGRMNLKVNATSKGTTPSSNSYQSFLFNDTDSSHTTWQSHRFGACEVQVLNTGENRMILSVYRNEANSTAGATMTLGTSSNGNWCTFPNTTCCDGQWVTNNGQVASNVSLPTGTDQEIEYDISSYLPNDNYNYEVRFSVDSQTGSGSGAGLSINLIGTGTPNSARTWVRINDMYARGSWVMVNGTHAIVPIGTNRKVVLHYTVISKAATLNSLHVEGYRRIGTNS